MNGPIPAMYSMKPIVIVSDNIILPTNMYKMKSIYSNSYESGIESNLEKVISNPIIEDIDTRQSLILLQLKELQNQMDLLKKQLSESSSVASTKKDISQYNSCSIKKISKPVFCENGTIRDVVINADPKYPPYSLLGVQKVWGDFFNLKMTCYVHSSILDFPNSDALSCFKSDRKEFVSDLPTLNVTLVWKNIGPDCELIVSPLNHCTVKGEINVLRYIHRQVNQDADILEETKLDGFLDTCYCLLHASSQIEKQSILRKLNATIGKSEWFGGSSISVCDLAAWSSIRNCGNLELVQKLSKWINQCNQLTGVKA